mmetsp:Transcript_146555/g.255716  ORF Transcript_146555/g.255716 Transcript_146555/m.255716 type:complete len:108 (-) Transcript_146555:109-432(-)
MLPGIKETVVGYTGGDNPEPTYESVCLGDGHSEALQVEYDESEISYEDLVGFFFQGALGEHNASKEAVQVSHHVPQPRAEGNSCKSFERKKDGSFRTRLVAASVLLA